MESRLLKRRESLFTVEEVAFELGVTPQVVEELELCFMTPLQNSYLNLLRYRVGFYPRRKHPLDERPKRKVPPGPPLSPEQKEARKKRRAERREKRKAYQLRLEMERANRISTL